MLAGRAYARRSPRFLVLAIVLSGAALGACLGPVGDLDGATDSSEPPNGGTGLSPSELPDPATCTETIPTVQLRRISREEYERGIETTFGLGLRVTTAFPPDPTVRGLDNNQTALGMSSTIARNFMEAAEAVSAKVASALPSMTGCAEGKTGDESCVRAFIRTKGRLAWRRTLSQAEQDQLYGFYATWAAMPGSDSATAYRAVVERMLNAPSFVYRPELGRAGKPGEVVGLSPTELASRLSFLLFGEAPDAELLDAAEAGRLESDADVLSRVDAMLADKRAAAGLRAFHKRVFSLGLLEGVQKNPTLFPGFNDAQASSMREEIYRLTEAAWERKDWSSLFSSTSTFVDDKLAPFYGAPAPSGGFQPFALDPSKRRGVLTTPGMMTLLAKSNESAPIRRGAWIREMIFCQHLEAPSGLAITPPEPVPNLTQRQQMEAHRNNAACSGCHSLMDPAGLPFEHYDAVGKWRDTQNSLPIDDSGELVKTDVEGTVQGAPALALKVSASKNALTCYGMHLFRWSMGRLEGTSDGCTLAKISDTFIKKGNDPKELVHALVASPVFRKVRLPEVSP